VFVLVLVLVLVLFFVVVLESFRPGRWLGSVVFVVFFDGFPCEVVFDFIRGGSGFAEVEAFG
jgi:hypothetical protein